MSPVELPALYVDNVALVAGGARLVVLNRGPSPGETGVPIDTALELELVDTGAGGVDVVATRVWVDGVLAFDGSASGQMALGFSGPSSGSTNSGDTLRIVLVPVVPLESLKTVAVRVVSQTVGGAATLDDVYSFEVEDRTAPRVVGARLRVAASNQFRAHPRVFVWLPDHIRRPARWRCAPPGDPARRGSTSTAPFTTKPVGPPQPCNPAKRGS